MVYGMVPEPTNLPMETFIQEIIGKIDVMVMEL